MTRIHSRIPASRALLFTAAALVAGAMGVTGCASPGHGKVTGEHLAKAEQRMNDMRAATEWDMAQQQFLAGDLRKSLKTVDKSISMVSSVAKSHTLRGRILLELGQPDAAFDAFQRALAIDPEHVEAHYYKGVVHERFRDQERAVDAFLTAAELDPTNPQYPLAAAELLMESGGFDRAEGVLLDRKSRFEHNAGFRQTLGHIAMMRGDDRLAAEHFNEAHLLAPDDDSIMEDLAIAQVGSGRFTEAEYTLGKLLKDSRPGDRRDLEHMWVRCLIELDRPVEARSILLGLTRGVEGGRDLRAWFDLGQVAYKLGDRHRLKIAAARLRAMAPNRYEGHFLMAAWQRLEGDLEGALTSLNRAASHATNESGPMLFRGLVLRDLGREVEAAQCFAEAARIDPTNRDAEMLLSSVIGDE